MFHMQGIRDVETKIEESEEILHSLKEEASAARDYYNEMTQLCCDKWNKIMELSNQEVHHVNPQSSLL